MRRSRVFTDRFQRPEDDPEASELMPVASRIRNPVKAGPLRLIARIVLLLLLVGLTVAVAYLLIPSAVITITPAQERLQVDAPFSKLARGAFSAAAAAGHAEEDDAGLMRLAIRAKSGPHER